MPEKVQIEISQATRGNALAETEAAIKKLYQSAAAYESKGRVDVAKSARGDARALEADLTRLAKERHVAERAITQEKISQSAQAKLIGGQRQRLLGAAANFAQSQAGLGGFGGVTSALGANAGPVATIATAAAALVAATIAYGANVNRDQRLAELGAEGDRARDRQRIKRLARDGTSGEARAEVEDARDERVVRSAQDPKLREASKPRWWVPWEAGLWAGNQFFGQDYKTPEGMADEADNDQGKIRAMQREVDARKLQKEKFASGGALDIAKAERIAAGDRRGARQIEYQQLYEQTRKQVRHEGGEDWQANEAAGLAVFNRQRKEGQGFARLIDARSGAGDISRAASLASGGIGGMGELTELVRQGNRAQETHRTLQMFAGKPYRPGQ